MSGPEPLDEKHLAVAREIETIRREKSTAKVELHFKDGKLISGKTEKPFLK